jgi:hypothetical protein
MAETRPSPRRRSYRGSVAFAGLCAFVACTNNVDSKARLIDDACANSACTLSGSARQTSGITADSIGFKVGPGAGKITIPIPPYASSNNYMNVEVLVSGHGQFTGRLMRQSCGDGGACAPTPVDTATIYVGRDYGWASVGTYSVGSGSSGFAGLSAEIEVTDSSANVDLLDVRYETFDTIRCSVSTPGAR